MNVSRIKCQSFMSACAGLGMRQLRSILVGLAGLAIWGVAIGGEASGDSLTAEQRLGQRMYRDGILPSGRPMTGMAQADVIRQERDAACTTCHRRSGYGTAEGYIVIRPISGPDLYQTGIQDETDPRIVHQLGKPLRPAYDDASLARAIREGVDMTGRVMQGSMPRYALSDTEMRALITYLKSLSATPSPGVDEREIHLATVIQPGVSTEKRRAMLEVLEAFIRDKNAGVRSEELRRKAGTMRMYRAYRKWVLHVWDLTGPPETWDGQLERLYREQPVFALVGGLGETSWQPIHAFSERFEVPCILPQTDFPVTEADNYYTLYFSRGITLEADALAHQLGHKNPAGRIVQVYRPETAGAVAAENLRVALAGSGSQLDDLVLVGTPSWEFVRKLIGDPVQAVILWLDRRGLDSASWPGDVAESVPVYLSTTLLGGQAKPNGFDGALLIYPWEVPSIREPRVLRSKQWLRLRGLDSQDETLQAIAVNTLFAINVSGDALMHMKDSFVRDYFVERVEHNISTTLMPSFFPRVSLGPDQRYASKGVYFVRNNPSTGLEFSSVSDWVVP